MPNTEGFLELAGIGGVFVGFAALIAVRSGDAGGLEMGYMRGVVTIGMLSMWPLSRRSRSAATT